MDLHWKLLASDSRGEIGYRVQAARLPDHVQRTYVYRTTWYKKGTRPAWAGLDEWDGGKPEQVIKERFGLSPEGCALHTLEQALEAIAHQRQPLPA